MAKRTQAYKLGFPERYFTQGDDSAGSDETHAAKMRARQKAYEEGKKIDLSLVAKKGGKVSRKALSAAVKKTLQAKAKKSGK